MMLLQIGLLHASERDEDEEETYKINPIADVIKYKNESNMSVERANLHVQQDNEKHKSSSDFPSNNQATIIELLRNVMNTCELICNKMNVLENKIDQVQNKQINIKNHISSNNTNYTQCLNEIHESNYKLNSLLLNNNKIMTETAIQKSKLAKLSSNITRVKTNLNAIQTKDTTKILNNKQKIKSKKTDKKFLNKKKERTKNNK